MLEIMIWVSAIIRIVICFLPQNNWCSDEGNLKLSIIRNGVFAVTGIARGRNADDSQDLCIYLDDCYGIAIIILISAMQKKQEPSLTSPKTFKKGIDSDVT